MEKMIQIVLGASLAAASLNGGALAQGAPQTVALVKVDTALLGTGHRTSKVVGATVYDETGDEVGAIDDLIVTPTEKVPFAILSVGGFPGIGDEPVAVPYADISVKDKKMVLPGATKEALKMLPDFKYAN